MKFHRNVIYIKFNFFSQFVILYHQIRLVKPTWASQIHRLNGDRWWLLRLKEFLASFTAHFHLRMRRFHQDDRALFFARATLGGNGGLWIYLSPQVAVSSKNLSPCHLGENGFIQSSILARGGRVQSGNLCPYRH